MAYNYEYDSFTTAGPSWPGGSTNYKVPEVRVKQGEALLIRTEPTFPGRSPIDQATIDSQRLIIKQLREANERMDKSLIQEKSINQGIRDSNNRLIKQVNEKQTRIYEYAGKVDDRDAIIKRFDEKLKEFQKQNMFTLQAPNSEAYWKDNAKYWQTNALDRVKELEKVRKELATQKDFVANKNDALNNWYKSAIADKKKIAELQNKLNKIDKIFNGTDTF